ncbi:putative peptidoglycan binding protein [Krasilnikovia cinnamomea]|uniref:Putative peptidoglycan binding protein n=1 Tax=Krasilnikovia cinnamomea TaxID=349313 RepID=A0A4Q7ZEI6_9ACTN|nr:glycoside hydrolase domain-containing protein [Krasilnikovia cinnamomea]RZU48694.1 putative peptidoglycan binding protein [Krasilnikovia cinnamomea]
MDSRVLDVQVWLNREYGSVTGFNRVAEDGITGWATMRALTRALQYELGISPLSDTFGPTTLARVTGMSGDIEGLWTTNRIKIVQGGFYCKGYDPGAFDGKWGSETKRALDRMMYDAGLPAAPDNTFPPKVLKALLTMDAFVKVALGTEAIRKVQQWLNGRYSYRQNFFLVPCEGVFSRDVQKALYLAIQYEVGLTDAQATGTFGPTTKNELRKRPVGSGSTGAFVSIFTAAMVFNRIKQPGFPYFEGFTDRFGEEAAIALRAFQKFSALPETGQGDFATWCQLLVSTGDPDRPAIASDTANPLTAARASALWSAGYRYVGRYLDNVPGSSLNKKIQPGELKLIFENGLKVFPIQQYYGGEVSYFNYNRGYRDALAAHQAAVGHGFDAGTTIYFAVDYDATQADIDDAIVPYFKGVVGGLTVSGKRYNAGVYGSRNVCIDVSRRTDVRWSFVSGMSSGFSGNMGYPLPENWSFNQIQTLTVGSGTGAVEIDKDAYRLGSDPGVNKLNSDYTTVDGLIQHVEDIYQLAKQIGGYNPNLLVLQFLRWGRYDTFQFNNLVGPIVWPWENLFTSRNLTPMRTLREPNTGIDYSIAHWAYSCEGVLAGGTVEDPNGFNASDVAGWGGDLMTFYGDWRRESNRVPSGLAFCREKLARQTDDNSFKLRDMLEDADAYNVAMNLRAGAKITDELDNLFRRGGYKRRFRSFFNGRFQNTANAQKLARLALVPGGQNPIIDLGRVSLIELTGGIPTILPHMLPGGRLDEFIQGFSDRLQELVAEETKAFPS